MKFLYVHTIDNPLENMTIKNLLLLSFVILPFELPSIEFMKDYFDYASEKPLPEVANDFVYGDGSTELTSQVNEYDNITAKTPIQGTLFVTHDKKNVVDENSFQLGHKKLKTTFVQTTQMTSTSNIVVSIYSFQLDGMDVGIHKLPSINVKVGKETVQALPLIIEINQ